MNSINQTEGGTWKDKKSKELIDLQIIQFKEDEVVIFYSPQLELSGYGNSFKEAENSFNIVLDEFFEYTIEKGILEKELRRLGWAIEEKGGNHYKPPEEEELKKKNDEYNHVINNFNYQIHKRKITIPA